MVSLRHGLWGGRAHGWEGAYTVDWMCLETGSDGETWSREGAKPERCRREEPGRQTVHTTLIHLLHPPTPPPPPSAFTATEAVLGELSLGETGQAHTKKHRRVKKRQCPSWRI